LAAFDPTLPESLYRDGRPREVAVEVVEEPFGDD